MELSLAEKSCILTARRRGIVDHAGLALAGVVTGPINRQFVAFTFALFGARPEQNFTMLLAPPFIRVLCVRRQLLLVV